MFEAFLDQQGHEYVFEPDWSQIVGRPINTRTDYLVQIDGSSIACEVKGFAPSDKRDKIWDWSKGSFWVGPDDEPAASPSSTKTLTRSTATPDDSATTGVD